MPVLVNNFRNEMIAVLRPPQTFSVLSKIFIKTSSKKLFPFLSKPYCSEKRKHLSFLKMADQPLGSQLSKNYMRKDSPIGIEANLQTPVLFRPNIFPILTRYHKTGYTHSIYPYSPKAIPPPKDFLVLNLLSSLIFPFASIISHRFKNSKHLNFKFYSLIKNCCKLKLISSMRSLGSLLKHSLVKLFINKSSLTKCIQNTGMLCH